MSDKRDHESPKCWGILHIGTNLPPIWWRKDAHGYSADIADAGLFTKERAERQDGPRRTAPLPRDEAKSPGEMLEFLEAEIQKADERLEKLCRLRNQITGDTWHTIRSTWDLVFRAVECPVTKHGRLPRWSHVGDIFALGSTSASRLCQRFGLDPDEPRGHNDEEEEESDG